MTKVLDFNTKPKRRDFIDLTGQKFDKLLVVDFAGIIKQKAFWLCKCDCGKIATLQSWPLRKGKVKSCGCLKIEVRKTHGHANRTGKSITYTSWDAMVQRCTNSKNGAYKDYGGRGITICKRWHTFENFLADMGERPSRELSIERIENNKGYYSENCKWGAKKIQQNNTRRNHYLVYRTQKMTISQWADELNISVNTIYTRINTLGWDVERTLSTPVRKINQDNLRHEINIEL